ncbi:DUF4178 domain-containing protein [Corynebacterium dentalis]|uniref:DUF4178 domain-containing protein n=1 Tax=Corynebacterium dentalis TaxID=2014528 RepID=UPI0028A09E24|nr:DUF4178 domain-containing protein [Corynebacterium dentalis]
MNWLWVIVGILVVLGGILLIMQGLNKRNEERGGNAQARTPKDPFAEVDGASRFSPKNIAPGAIIRHGQTDYVVRGSLEINQGPYVWHEHMVDGGNGSRYFSVEVDEGTLELILWEKSPSSTEQEPPSETEVNGVRFRESERGPAHYRSTGTTGLDASGDMRYVDYEATGADDSRRLSYEKFGDAPWEISLGHVIYPGELTVYPAPEQ